MIKIEELLVVKGLYEPIEITYKDNKDLSKIISNDEDHQDIIIDCYCLECGVKRVFKGETIFDPSLNRGGLKITDKVDGLEKALFKGYLNKHYPLKFKCSYKEEHIIYFDLITTNDKMIKIGQYPSDADLYLPEIKKYEKVLDKNLYKEFRRALLLHSYGIGIGAFVYLRRIIEQILYNQFKDVSNKIQLSEQEFINLKFNEKIERLIDYLPQSLVKNKNMYGIVSKGIHELSEEECLNYFNFIRNGIELILDDIVAKKVRIAKEKEVEVFVAKTTGELRGNR